MIHIIICDYEKAIFCHYMQKKKYLQTYKHDIRKKNIKSYIGNACRKHNLNTFMMSEKGWAVFMNFS